MHSLLIWGCRKSEAGGVECGGERDGRSVVVFALIATLLPSFSICSINHAFSRRLSSFVVVFGFLSSPSSSLSLAAWRRLEILLEFGIYNINQFSLIGRI